MKVGATCALGKISMVRDRLALRDSKLAGDPSSPSPAHKIGRGVRSLNYNM